MLNDLALLDPVEVGGREIQLIASSGVAEIWAVT